MSANLGSPNRRWLVLFVAAVLLIVGLAGGVWYFVRDAGGPPPPPSRVPPPEDPRLTYTGPFLNIGPDVKYVGSASCGGSGCHDNKIASYRHHPMGRSLFKTIDTDPAPPEDRQHNLPFEAFGAQFRIEHSGRSIRQHRAAFDGSGRPIYDAALEATYTLGSGSHGHSYLAVLEGGYVVQTPMSWYAGKKMWDVSAGFGERLTAGRPVSGDCLYCHSNHATLIDGTLNRYQEPIFDELAIGCERCHGPGEKHVAARRAGERVAGDVDYTIVNPDHLTPELRDAVCEQCHMTGEFRVPRRGRRRADYRPGLRLEDFVTILVHAADSTPEDKSVTHVEQMHLSRCFRESKADHKLGCVSCHDPHVHVVKPAERIKHYRESCLACHEDHPCNKPLAERIKTSKEDSCIACHMPRSSLSDIPHAAGTDHRILRDPASDEANTDQLPASGGWPVVPFHARAGAPLGPELDRDLAVGLTSGILSGSDEGGTAIGNMHLTGLLALRRLEEAVKRDPEDWEAWQGKATALMVTGKTKEALADLERILADNPHREKALLQAAMLAEADGRPEQAIDYWRRAIEMNPWHPMYRQSLCRRLVKQQAWDELRPQCEAWLRLDPASIAARQTWVDYLLHAGRKDEARAEFEKIRALRPNNLPDLQVWFDEESKKR